MTSLYKVLFDYDTDKDDELSLKVGETIRITNKDSPDWWLAERFGSKERGLVPSNFIEKIPTEDKGMKLAVVTRDYTAQAQDELSLERDRVITVLDQNIAEGWWKGNLNGKIGIFPANHVEFVEENSHPGDEENKTKHGFKLAAYGVKQGGIGSILAGGLPLKRHSTSSNRGSLNERPTSSNSVNQHDKAPSIPTKPHSSLAAKVNDQSSNNTNAVNKNNLTLKAMAIHDYKPEHEDELKLMRGEYITIIDKLEDNGWWKGVNESGITGIFPSNFVQILDDEKPPQRPVRARPATVKSETSTTASINTMDNSKGMGRPPPVPITTRPTSLLTNRDNQNSSSSHSTTIASPPPPRPVTLPPPRPTTMPPTVPSTVRRTSSIISPPTVDINHRHVPSIPLVSPDLPPLSPIYDRPTRILPNPISTSNSNETIVSPPSRSSRSRNLESVTSPTASHLPTHSMAKPPKINFANKSINSNSHDNNIASPSQSPSSRPVSINDSLEDSRKSSLNNETTLPLPPKRSMPPVPDISINANINERKRPPHPSIAPPAVPTVTDMDPMDAKIRQIIKVETEKIRKEFEKRLEDERIERLKLQAELEELRAYLNP
ncbi:SH3 domain-containing protein [Cokeromyces recurvatus]|uniref:SH3 domain-containing protein n=1 Tax=Cokeromyces recurvatus TaxID=90255 RepID=UPI002220F796|nr:SH3 domain-containing protein [Cokeromyces recurvatus]KAI7907595.1 SH3 domain-containing protein [Cokeromyces recurvatus]